MDKFKIIAFCVIALVIGIAIANIFNSCKKPQGTITVHDTTVITRYEKELVRDTVIKWYEKIVWRNVLPEIIYQQKIDSVFVETIKYKDLMLKIEKKGNSLKIFAVNINDSLIKEYNFADVGQDFIATSTTGNIFVKSKKFYFYGIEPFANYSLDNIKDWKGGNFNIGIRTGIEGFNFALKPYINYNTQYKDLRAGLELSYKLKL